MWLSCIPRQPRSRCNLGQFGPKTESCINALSEKASARIDSQPVHPPQFPQTLLCSFHFIEQYLAIRHRAHFKGVVPRPDLSRPHASHRLLLKAFYYLCGLGINMGCDSGAKSIARRLRSLHPRIRELAEQWISGLARSVFGNIDLIFITKMYLMDIQLKSKASYERMRALRCALNSKRKGGSLWFEQNYPGGNVEGYE